MNRLFNSKSNIITFVIFTVGAIIGVWLMLTEDIYGTAWLIPAVLIAPFIINIIKSLFRRRGQ